MFIKKISSKDQQKKNNEQGVLFSSGLVAGDALIGVVVAFMIGGWVTYANFYDSHDGMMLTIAKGFGPWLSLIAFAALAAIVAHLAYRGFDKKS
jgi:membrane protein implicated in regulation of membrane protease activity